MNQSAPAALSKTIRVAVAVLGAVIAAIVISRLLPDGIGERGDPRPALEREWKSHPALGLTVRSPARFRAITLPVPPEIRTSIERMESYGRNVGRTEIRISRIEYLPDVPLSLEGSAQGAIDAMRVNPAITQMTYSHARRQVSGLSAVHTTSTFHLEGRPAHGEILTVLRGRTLWQVQVLGPVADTPEIARRVMGSVRVEP